MRLCPTLHCGLSRKEQGRSQPKPQPEAEQPEEMQPMQGMETETPEPMPEMGEEL